MSLPYAEGRAALAALADALDAVLTEDEERARAAAERDEYVRELETDNVRVAAALTAAQDQLAEHGAASKAAETELRGMRKLLRAADAQLAEVRAKEVAPRDEQIAALRAQVEAMRTAPDAESDAIAYRLHADGVPDIVVRWTGGELWAVTNGRSRYWSSDRGWLDDHGGHAHRHPERTHFSRTDALTHARALMDAAQSKKRNPQ